MRLINPVGRNVSLNADDENNPNACMERYLSRIECTQLNTLFNLSGYSLLSPRFR